MICESWCSYKAINSFASTLSESMFSAEVFLESLLSVPADIPSGFYSNNVATFVSAVTEGRQSSWLGVLLSGSNAHAIFIRSISSSCISTSCKNFDKILRATWHRDLWCPAALTQHDGPQLLHSMRHCEHTSLPSCSHLLEATSTWQLAQEHFKGPGSWSSSQPSDSNSASKGGISAQKT